MGSPRALLPSGIICLLALAAACSTASAPSSARSPAVSATHLAVAPTVAASGHASVVYHGATTRRAVALTFDIGADADAAGVAATLVTLRAEGVRATFAVSGLWVEEHRDIALRIAADGHQIINGGYHGASFTGASTGGTPLGADERSLELSRTETTVYHLTQRSTRPYFRPPFGDVDAGVLRDAGNAGFATAVLSSVDCFGPPGASSGEIVASCIAAASPGAILELRADAGAYDPKALPRVIAALRAEGYTFETVDVILR